MKVLITCGVLAVSSLLIPISPVSAAECPWKCTSWDQYGNCINGEFRCRGGENRGDGEWRKPRYGVDEHGPYRHLRDDSRRERERRGD